MCKIFTCSSSRWLGPGQNALERPVSGHSLRGRARPAAGPAACVSRLRERPIAIRTTTACPGGLNQLQPLKLTALSRPIRDGAANDLPPFAHHLPLRHSRCPGRRVYKCWPVLGSALRPRDGQRHGQRLHLRSGVDDDGVEKGRNNRPVRICIDDALTKRGAALGDSLRLPAAASSPHRHLRRRLHGRATVVQT